MADLRDPGVALQVMSGMGGRGYRLPAEQISGTQIGYVLDNDVTNPTINPPGTCRVVVPAYSVVSAFGPISYPGTLVPPGGGVPGPKGPGGTQCNVSFVPPTANSPSAAAGQITSFINWPPVSGSSNPPVNESTAGQTFFNTSINALEYFNGTAWVLTSSGAAYNEDFAYFLAG